MIMLKCLCALVEGYRIDMIFEDNQIHVRAENLAL